MKWFGLLIAVFLLSVAAYSAQVNATVTWTVIPPAGDNIRLERSVDKGAYTTIAVLPPDAVSFLDANIAFGKEVCYRPVSFNSLGDSAVVGLGCNTAPGTPGGTGSVTVVISVTP